MSYSVVDTSVQDGLPVELYQFRQNGQEWYFTSSADVYSHAGVDYKPAPIMRESLTQAGDINRSSINLTLPRDHEIALQFIGGSPDFVTTVSILRVHLTDGADEVSIYWKGRVMSAKADGATLKLTCDSAFSSLMRMGLRATYQRSCRHSLFSKNCGANMDSYKLPVSVLSVVGNNVACAFQATPANGHYTGGIMLLQDGAMRFITTQVGGTLTLARPFNEGIQGTTVYVYPGCDHLKVTCMNKFNNLLNFGGFPYIPNVNPFGGTSIA